jgi:hypothetical protein
MVASKPGGVDELVQQRACFSRNDLVPNDDTALMPAMDVQDNFSSWHEKERGILTGPKLRARGALLQRFLIAPIQNNVCRSCADSGRDAGSSTVDH